MAHPARELALPRHGSTSPAGVGIERLGFCFLELRKGFLPVPVEGVRLAFRVTPLFTTFRVKSSRRSVRLRPCSSFFTFSSSSPIRFDEGTPLSSSDGAGPSARSIAAIARVSIW
jgi:hypothetical protein